MAFLGVHQPADTRAGRRNEVLGPKAIIVGSVGSPGVHLDLGRVRSAVPGTTTRQGAQRECDVLLVMTRKRAVLLYFVVGADVR